MGLFEELRTERPWYARGFVTFHKARYKAAWRWDRFRGRMEMRFPRLVNEGEATSRVVNMAFDGYPMDEDFASKEEAVMLLQSIWDVIDNWDGSRLNVKWSQGRELPDGGVTAWARRRPLGQPVINAIQGQIRSIQERSSSGKEES